MVTCVSLILALAVLVSAELHAQVPGTISYQGILSGGGGNPISNGAHTLRIAFYYTPTGGDPVHREVHAVLLPNSERENRRER